MGDHEKMFPIPNPRNSNNFQENPQPVLEKLDIQNIFFFQLFMKDQINNKIITRQNI